MRDIWMLVAALCVATSAMAQSDTVSSAEVTTPVEAVGSTESGYGKADGLMENGALARYHRSSLYSVLMSHSSFPYGSEIEQAFFSIPTPDKFNDHNLSVRSFESSARKMRKGKKAEAQNLQDIEDFIRANDVPRELVAKWFNRDLQTGGFDINLML
ncbi:MAG: hypothetical protein IKM37_02210, partial [Alistipes sp.]|nr:hypothetical protein [Alistipes sp.]